MSASQRRKGHDFERQIARIFREQLGIEARRGWQSRSGVDDPDVVVPGLWIECKRGKSTNIKGALAQACRASASAGNGDIPVAISKDDGEEILVTMAFCDWLDLCGGEIAALGGSKWVRSRQARCSRCSVGSF